MTHNTLNGKIMPWIFTSFEEIWNDRNKAEYRPNKGVFLVTATIAFVFFERDLSMNTDSQISTEGMSKVSERARERSERSEAERCGASERSERWERTNVASDRMAR